MMLETCRFLAEKNISEVKLQLLHILKNTDLVELYRKKTFDILDMMEYIDIIISCPSGNAAAQYMAVQDLSNTKKIKEQ